jgi:hypothetical protein
VAFILLSFLVLGQKQILIEHKNIPWESTQTVYVDSLYRLIYSPRILELKLVTSTADETLNLNYKFIFPDTYLLKFPKRLNDFRVYLIVKTGEGQTLQRLRLYLAERKIIVYRDIRPQKMFVFEGDSLVNEFLVSTGRQGHQTALGEYKILTKHRRAWSKRYRIWMDWWQSFYMFPSGIFNGLHALDQKTGYEELLGRPASHGCVRISQKDGKWLFEWTDVGIRFSIRRNFESVK